MGFGMTEMLIILAIVLVIFGAGKLPSVMGDLAKGVRNFKAGMKDDPEPPPTCAGAADRPADRRPTATRATGRLGLVVGAMQDPVGPARCRRRARPAVTVGMPRGPARIRPLRARAP